MERCKSCGASVIGGTEKCPYCGTEYEKNGGFLATLGNMHGTLKIGDKSYEVYIGNIETIGCVDGITTIRGEDGQIIPNRHVYKHKFTLIEI